jgi:nucleoside-diphosphate-sugar epimerase
MAGGRIAVMLALVIGGTGLISRGIVKHLLARGAEVRAFNRGKCAAPPLPADVRSVLGDRDDAEALSAVAGENFDVVIDMVCFRNQQAAAAVAAFGGKCRHYIFCSTVCTYGTGSSSTVLIDESSPQRPTSGCGRDKVACEQIFFEGLRRSRCQCRTLIASPSSSGGPSTARRSGSSSSWSWHGARCAIVGELFDRGLRSGEGADGRRGAAGRP